MNAIMDANSVTSVAMPLIEDKALTYITTTLYDLISAVQAAVEPGSNDDLVVATVRHILDSGHVTWCDHVATCTI